MEIKGYKSQSEPREFSLFDADEILDYVEEMGEEEIIVIETSSSREYVKVHFFIREDGEQLNLNIEGK